MGITRVEKRFLDFLERHFFVVIFVVITIVALFIRFKMINFESGDYLVYLGPWAEEIKNRGLRDIFSSGGIGDYNSPYILLLWFLTKLPFSILYSIKAISIMFDFGVAIMAMMIVRYLLIIKKTQDEKRKFISICTYSAVVLLPTVVLNGALWGQCDSIYAFFVLASIYSLIKKRNNLSFILLGLAFAFKLQFIFVLPIYLLIYLKNRDFSILNFLWIPAMLIIASIPALICGLPFENIFGIYFTQIGEYQKLTLANMNVYKVFSGDYEYVSLLGYATFLLSFGALFYYMIVCKKRIGIENVLPLMLLSILICTCFLPSMHERYGYLADIMSIMYFAAGYGSIFVPITTELLSLMGYFEYLFGLDVSGYKLLGLAPVIVIIYIWRGLILGQGNKKTDRLLR